jgi:hypothetical protein
MKRIVLFFEKIYHVLSSFFQGSLTLLNMVDHPLTGQVVAVSIEILWIKLILNSYF